MQDLAVSTENKGWGRDAGRDGGASVAWILRDTEPLSRGLVEKKRHENDNVFVITPGGIPPFHLCNLLHPLKTGVGTTEQRP